MRLTPPLLLCALLAGCASQTVISRSSRPDAFVVRQSGQIPPAMAQDFADCVQDGFAASRNSFSSLKTRMQRREDGIRVELFTDGPALTFISADVGNDGKVQVLEPRMLGEDSNAAAKAAFARCLDQFEKA